MAPGMRAQARLTVEVRCDEPHWRIYIGVTLHTIEQVVVTTHPLTHLAVIGPGDLAVVEREINQLPGGYYRSPEQLYGTTAGRMIGAGEVVTPSLVQIPPLIRRGQQVTVVARSGGLEVRRSGTALTDGGLSQRIQVQTGSGYGVRPVEGVVRAADLVEVALP
jgi:flagella basal body P-ring formation protein FlgA